jgi:hypothetical protein
MQTRQLGRLYGASMLVAFAIGIVSNFKWQSELFAEGGLLVNATQHPVKVGLIALSGFVTAVLGLVIASMLKAHFATRHSALTTLYVALLAAGVASSLAELSTLIAFRTLSDAYAAAATGDVAMFAPAKAALTGLRNGVHFLDKLLGGIAVLVMYVFLDRARLVPRVLCGVGVVAAACQFVAVSSPLLGYGDRLVLLAPLALIYLVTTVWLLVRGFDDRETAA